jgi:hypothetical protein
MTWQPVSGRIRRLRDTENLTTGETLMPPAENEKRKNALPAIQLIVYINDALAAIAAQLEAAGVSSATVRKLRNAGFT